MSEQRWEWLIDEVPATDDPDVVRAYIRDLRSIDERTPVIESMIASAERLVIELEHERAQPAA